MATLAGVGLILAQKDTTSTSVCQETSGYKNFNNSYLTFRYPSNLTVTQLANRVQINTGNGQNGIIIKVISQSQYLAVKNQADSDWQLEYELENSGGVSYKEYSRNRGNVTIYRYLFTKNGRYYDMYGNLEDDYLMVQLLDSVQ